MLLRPFMKRIAITDLGHPSMRIPGDVSIGTEQNDRECISAGKGEDSLRGKLL